MNSALSSVCCSAASLCSIDGATHWTECPNRCNSRKHCISKPTSGSTTIRRPSKMPVRGGSRSRYSTTKPRLTIAEVTGTHSETRSAVGSAPTRRVPTSSWPGMDAIEQTSGESDVALEHDQHEHDVDERDDRREQIAGAEHAQRQVDGQPEGYERETSGEPDLVERPRDPQQ